MIKAIVISNVIVFYIIGFVAVYYNCRKEVAKENRVWKRSDKASALFLCVINPCVWMIFAIIMTRDYLKKLRIFTEEYWNEPARW